MREGSERVNVLFVCMGNICRSPTAEGVFTELVKRQGFGEQLRIDSAGTIDYHTGEAPDSRAQEASRRRGIDIGHLRARQVAESDYCEFDYVLAMDRENLNYMMHECPHEKRDRLSLFLDFAPDESVREVPDPYYGGQNGFDRVFALVLAASEGLLSHIQEHHRL